MVTVILFLGAWHASGRSTSKLSESLWSIKLCFETVCPAVGWMGGQGEFFGMHRLRQIALFRCPDGHVCRDMLKTASILVAGCLQCNLYIFAHNLRV
jgi:hypothetical protein